METAYFQQFNADLFSCTLGGYIESNMRYHDLLRGILFDIHITEERTNMMKKLFSVFLIFAAMSSLASCQAPATGNPPAPTAAQTGQQATNTPAEVPPEPGKATPASTTTGPVDIKLEITDAYPALSFNKPLYFTTAGDGSRDCFVVEQTGRILIFEDSSNAAKADTFLDLSKRIDLGGDEKGLLGLAFHPDYQKNGYLYVNYTNKNNTVIARYTRRADNPGKADPASEQIILTFPQPYTNHNGGQVAFGPDGYLYIGTGDGGSSGDPKNNAQNRSSLLGKILRIDVDHPDSGRAYGIPADNPYAGNQQGYREEIYALGLRNPWRFSFNANGTLWAADVGQNKREEIDLIQKGGNYGWNVMEGTLDFKKNPNNYKAELTLPILDYGRDQGACITGGYVYGSDLIGKLKGKYIYGDFVSGRIWALWIDENMKAQNQELLDTTLKISSFGLNADGDLRIVDLAGKLYRLQVPGQ